MLEAAEFFADESKPAFWQFIDQTAPAGMNENTTYSCFVMNHVFLDPKYIQHERVV